jgi:hypothetical protein
MGKYDSQWRRYRRLRLLHRLGYCGFLPFLIVLAILHQLGVPISPLVLAAYILFFLVVEFRFIFFRCPRCRRFFASAWRYSPKLYTPECLNCGLKKFSHCD